MEDWFEKCKEEIKPDLGTLKQMEAKSRIVDDAEPTINIGYDLKAKLKAELEQLEREGVLSKVDYSGHAHSGHAHSSSSIC